MAATVAPRCGHGGGHGGGHHYGGGGGHHYGGGGGRHYGGGGGGRYAYHGGGRHYGGGGNHYAYKNHGYKDHGNKHYANKDHDHHDHGNIHNRHRVFRNGVWVWAYGPGYTAYGDDCYWLYREASITGSPYLWDRYYACVGYDYY